MFRLRAIYNPNLELQKHIERCALPNCSISTKFGKKYCTDHVFYHDYVKKIEIDVRSRVVELKQIDDAAELPEKSHLIAEVKAILWERGVISDIGLARHICITKDQAYTLLQRAERRGLCNLRTSKRKKLIAKALFPNGGPGNVLLGR